jgi:hypothetical protein
MVKRRRFVRLGVVALVFVGCQDTDPESSRFSPGDRAVISGPPGDNVFVRTTRKADDEGEMIFVPVGTTVRVESDEEKTAPPSGGPPRDVRKVRALATDGPVKGQTIEVSRYELRPLK